MLKLPRSSGKMDCDLAYHELLICLHHWFDVFRSLDPLAKPYFRLRRRFQRFSLAKFSNIRLLILHISANIFCDLPNGVKSVT